MCTIHRFTSEHSASHIAAIRNEWNDNPDGCVIIEIDESSNVVGMFKTVSKDSAIRYLLNSIAAEFIVHLRAATGSNVSIATIHGFTSRCGEWVYVHNGVIPNADNYIDVPYVDSLAIGEILHRCDDAGFSEPLPFDYANVIAVNVISGDIMCHKSSGGSLHHNPLTGSISTRPIKGCDKPVKVVGWFSLNPNHNKYATAESQWLAKFYPDRIREYPDRMDTAEPSEPRSGKTVKSDECHECGQSGVQSNKCRYYLPPDFKNVCGGKFVESTEYPNMCICDRCLNMEYVCRTCGRIDYCPE